MKFILASQSPRRRELLGLLRFPFEVQVADIDETMDPALPPEQEVARISREKALAVPREPEDVVIAADTIVVRGNQILGKPHSREEAIEMLTLLSDGEHRVMTGMTVICGEEIRVCTEITGIHFRKLSPREIEAYVDTGEPMDKAGAYGIQGGAALFCSHMEGDYYNVMGLPVCRLTQILKEMVPQQIGEEV